MFSKNGALLVAILLASSAAAASLPGAEPGGVPAVIDAIKAQLKAQNISHEKVAIDKTEAHLRETGLVNDMTLSELDDQIKMMTSQGGISIDDIAEILIQELRFEDAIQKRALEGSDKDVLVIDPDLVKRVMARDSKIAAVCPPGTRNPPCCQL